MKIKKNLLTSLFMAMLFVFCISKTNVYALSNYRIASYEISSFDVKNEELTIVFHKAKAKTINARFLNKSINPSPIRIHEKSLTFKMPKKTKWRLKTADLEYKKISYKKFKQLTLKDGIDYRSFLDKNNLKHSKKAASKYFRSTFEDKKVTYQLFFDVRKGKIVKNSFCIVEEGYNVLLK